MHHTNIKIQRLNGIAMNNNNGFIKPFLVLMLAFSMLVIAGCDSGSSSNGSIGPGSPTDPDGNETPEQPSIAAFYISAVEGVTSPSVSRGILGDMDIITAGLKIKFNGRIDSDDFETKKTSILVYSVTKNSPVNYANLYIQGTTTLVIQFQVALSDNEQIDICLPILRNESKNPQTDGTREEGDLVWFDKEVGSSCGDNTDTNKQYIRVALQAPEVSVSNIPQESVVELSIQPTDGEGYYKELSKLSPFFVDNNSEKASINRLNSATDAENRHVIEWLYKMADAFATHNGTVLEHPLSDVDIINNQVRIRFRYPESKEATDYELQLHGGPQVLKPIDMIKQSANVEKDEIDAPYKVTFKNKADGTEAYFILDNVEPGWTLKVRGIAKGSDGNEITQPSNWKDLELLDMVPPTTVIQESYGHGEGMSILTGTGGGSGGSLGGATAVPNMNITPFIYSGGGNAQASLSKLYAAKEFDSVSDAVSGLDVTQDYTSSYDTDAFNEWNKDHQTVEMAVGFTGDIAIAGNATYAGSATLSDFRAENNVGGKEENDLVFFTVSNLLNFANSTTAAGSSHLLSFENVVQDAASPGRDSKTFANSSAQVVVKDKMPPFITKAELTNTKGIRRVTITFNEPIVIEKNGIIKLLGGDELRAASAKGPAKEITFVNSEINNRNSLQRVMVTLKKDDTMYYNYVPLHFDNIKDGQGNSWQAYLASGSCNANATGETCFDELPVYMMALPLFERNGKPVATNFQAGKDAFKVVYNFNLPLDPNLETMLADGAQIEAFGFRLSSGVALDSSSYAEVNDTQLVLNVKLNGGQTLKQGDYFDAPRNFSPASNFQLFDPPQGPIDPDTEVVGASSAEDAPRVN